MRRVALTIVSLAVVGCSEPPTAVDLTPAVHFSEQATAEQATAEQAKKKPGKKLPKGKAEACKRLRLNEHVSPVAIKAACGR